MTRQNPTVVAKVAVLSHAGVCQTTLGELHFGALRSGRVRREARKVREALRGLILYDLDAITARRYAEIKADLTAAGTPIPENDLWIAAAAARRGITLVTHDAHFRRIRGLPLQVWPT